MNGETFSVNVNTVEDKNGMPVTLAINNGTGYVRSSNGLGASFPYNLAGNLVGATVYYQKGPSNGNQTWADQEYQQTAAHEIGHGIITQSNGAEYSWGHEGTTTLNGDDKALATVPATGSLNLMQYYKDASVNTLYTRSQATENDVKNLIYISTHH